jgi:SAM-dependent methyltransferase
VAIERRLSFGNAADDYERVRPGYPGALVQDVLAYAGLAAGDRVLEIGAGTGKATRVFVAHGADMVCLEPDPEMARILRSVCPEVEVELVGFEDYVLPDRPFGLVISAQAWHWLDGAVRYAKTADALAPGAALAVFWNDYELPSPIRERVDAIWRRRVPTRGRDYQAVAELLAATGRDLSAAGFVDVEERRYAGSDGLDADGYLALLATTSGYLVLSDDLRAEVLAELREALAASEAPVALSGETQLFLGRTPG